MTTEEFIKNAVGYYNKAYTPTQMGVVSGTLNSIPDHYKADILLRIMDTFSLRFRTPPGVSEIKEAMTFVLSSRKTTAPAARRCEKCGLPVFGESCDHCVKGVSVLPSAKELFSD